MFRKPVHTDRYLDFNSHHNIKHKLVLLVELSLIHRAQTLLTTKTSRQDELQQITTTLQCNRYPDKIVRKILRDSTSNTLVPSPEELVGQFFKHFMLHLSHKWLCHFTIQKWNNWATLAYFT